MNKITSILRSQQQYFILYLAGAFVLFVITWLITQAPEARLVHADTGIEASSSQASGQIEPSADNVSPAASQQLEALRLRVVKAPEDTTHVLRLARMLHDAHQVEEAARNYRHYLALRPQNRQAWLDFTRCLGQLEAWEEAEEAVGEMLNRYPDDDSGLYNLGAVYANTYRIDEAKIIWDKVIAQQGDPEVVMLARTSLDRLKSFVKPGLAEAK